MVGWDTHCISQHLCPILRCYIIWAHLRIEHTEHAMVQEAGMVANAMDVMVLDIVRCQSNVTHVSIPAGIAIVNQEK